MSSSQKYSVSKVIVIYSDSVFYGNNMKAMAFWETVPLSTT